MQIQKFLSRKKIGVIYGGRSAERKISLASGTAVLKALKNAGLKAVGIDAGPDLPFALKKNRIDFAYLALHGPGGEDGTVQGLLEVMGIPYSGCGVLASALAMDKVATKQVLHAAQLPTPAWMVLEDPADAKAVKRFPAVVKPATQGSAIGVSVVRAKGQLSAALKQAFTLDRRVLVEQYVAGTEITVGVLGGTALPVVEIVPVNAFYDFESKYQPGKSEHIIPPRLSKAVITRIQALAVKTFRALQCRAVTRIDMIVDARGNPWILEANTIPGMTETSLLPDEARAAGISFQELILKIIEYSLNER